MRKSPSRWTYFRFGLHKGFVALVGVEGKIIAVHVRLQLVLLFKETARVHALFHDLDTSFQEPAARDIHDITQPRQHSAGIMYFLVHVRYATATTGFTLARDFTYRRALIFERVLWEFRRISKLVSRKSSVLKATVSGPRTVRSLNERGRFSTVYGLGLLFTQFELITMTEWFDSVLKTRD